MIEKTLGFVSAINSIAETAETDRKNLRLETVPLNVAELSGGTKIGELNNFALSVKSLLDDRSNRPEKKSPNTPENPSLYETLQKIDALPEPTRKGIPSFFPPEIREKIYDQRVRDYNNQRASLAEYAIGFAEPPTLKNFGSANLPPKLKALEYREALSAYNQNLSDLHRIYREAKQGNLELNPQYQTLPAETKQLLNELLIKNQDKYFNLNTLISLAKTRGFNHLDTNEQKQFLNYVGGTNEEISQPANNALNLFLGDAATDKTDPETFRRFIREQHHLDFVYHIPGLSAPPDTYNPFRRSYKISGPDDVSNHQFHSGEADALKYEVEIDGKTFQVYLPENPVSGQYYAGIDEVAKGLAGLPKESFDAAKSVSVEPQRNPDDPYFAKLYKSPGFRSYMSAGADGNINIYPTTSKSDQSSLDSSLIHETGHIISGRKLVHIDPKLLESIKNTFELWRGLNSWDDWEKAMQDDIISPSDYARKSPGEDFSETLVLYLKYKGTPQEAEFRAIMPERFALMDKVLGD